MGISRLFPSPQLLLQRFSQLPGSRRDCRERVGAGDSSGLVWQISVIPFPEDEDTELGWLQSHGQHPPTLGSNRATNAPGNPDLNSHVEPDHNWLLFPTGSRLGGWQIPFFSPADSAKTRDVLHWDMIRDNKDLLLITEESK